MQEVKQEIVNSRYQIKHTASIDSNFLNSQEFVIIEDEAEILKRMGKYIGGLTRVSKNQTKEIIFTPLEEEMDLHEYLSAIKSISMECALISSANILTAYYELFKLNIIHRDIKSENIIINPYDNFKIVIVDAGSAICKIKKNMEDFHDIFHISNKICGTGAFAAPPIVRKIFENASNKKKIAMELALYNPKLVSEFIQKDNYIFASKFSHALLTNNGNLTLMQLIKRIKKYALPILRCNPLAAEVFAGAIVNEATKSFESTRELRDELQTIHDSFKIGTHLKTINPDLKKKLDPSNAINYSMTEDNEELLYDQKTDMYSLGRVLEDIAAKIDSKANGYIKEHLITFINLCRHYKAKSRPTIAQAIKYFDILKKYNHLITNINNTKEMESFISQNMHLDESRASVYINVNKLADLIKKNNQVDFEKLNIYKNIILVVEKGAAFSKAEEINFLFKQYNLHTPNYILKVLRESNKPLPRPPQERRYSHTHITNGKRTLQRKTLENKKSLRNLNDKDELFLNQHIPETPILIEKPTPITKETELENKLVEESTKQNFTHRKMSKEGFFKRRFSHNHIEHKIYLENKLPQKKIPNEIEINLIEKKEDNTKNSHEHFKFFKRLKTKSKRDKKIKEPDSQKSTKEKRF